VHRCRRIIDTADLDPNFSYKLLIGSELPP
jgi:hypothetical protein